MTHEEAREFVRNHFEELGEFDGKSFLPQTGDPIGPIARLELARAFSACGDRASAATVYQDLLNLWQDAELPSRQWWACLPYRCCP
jgi:hypothetical protein